MDRGAWWATVHGVAKSRTRLSDFTHSLTICVFSLKFCLIMWFRNEVGVRKGRSPGATKQKCMDTPISVQSGLVNSIACKAHRQVSMQSESHSVVSNSLQPHGLQLARFLCPWDSPGKNTAVGCHSLLQRIFLTQGVNPGSCITASLVAQMIKHLPAMWEIWVRSLGGEDPLEKGMAALSSTLAWKMPWTEEPGGLHSIELPRVRRD